MNAQPLTVWCGTHYPLEIVQLLTSGLQSHRLVQPKTLATLNLSAAPPDPSLAEADIAFGQPDPEQLLAPNKLRWVHITTAGYTRYDRNDLREAFRARGVPFTNSSSVYAEPCAQHLLAMILAHARQLPQALESQRTTCGWPAAEIRAKSRLMGGQTVLLLGFGAIARRLAELLSPLKMNLVAVRRQVTGDETVPTLAEQDLVRFLAIADHIVNVLPASRSTEAFVSADRLKRVKPGAVLYNVGRGTTIDQEALIDALHSGRLAAAYLDVTEPEPLPPQHPLWKTPNCYITPHTAGGHADEFERIVKHFLANFNRFVNGKPLVDRVF